jgi:deoxyribonuclease V
VIAAVDVGYDEPNDRATAAAVVFDRWEADVPLAEHVVEVGHIQPYIPGEFYRRELPYLLAVLQAIGVPLDVVIVDGYVDLVGKPGLGRHLWDALGQRVAVVGVAKSRFRGASAVEVVRGRSRLPLLVSAAGMAPSEAARRVGQMAGPFRIPLLLKRLDQLSKGI